MLERNVSIAQANPFDPQNPLLISAVGELAINLREALRGLEKECGIKLVATHDLASSVFDDVATLIENLRHSYAHSSTTKNKNMKDSSNRLSWIFYLGKTKGMLINDISLGCDYDDEMGINFGQNVVLLKRHLLLAHNYCAFAVNHLAQNHFAHRQIAHFNDPVIAEHSFWKSAENNLPSIGITF